MHVTKELSAYCHDELTPAASRRVAEHLMGCGRCRAEYELIMLGVKLAEQLPQVAAPSSLWSDLESRLTPGTQVEKRQARGRFQLLQPRYVAVAAGLVLAIVLAAIWLNRSQSGPFWEVLRLDGTPRIGTSSIGAKGRLGLGQWLETDGQSRAQISVGRIGQVEIDPNTRVRLLETKATEHRLELARGRMSARIWAPPKLFFVDTPSAVAADLGCAYTLEVDDHGGSLLRVTTGWVALQLRDRESTVPAGAACATRQGIGPGTPYFEDAAADFRSALTNIDFGADATTKDQSLQTLLAVARVRDTLTLWHLLARVDENQRAQVYERMIVLVPPPSGVTRAGVLALNQEMLDSWKETLQANWNNYSSPTMKALKQAWTTGLGKVNGLEGKK